MLERSIAPFITGGGGALVQTSKHVIEGPPYRLKAA
jgi:hypothetical protein